MNEGHIYIYGIITSHQDDGTESQGGFNSKILQQQLKLIGNVDVINVHIRSEGGSVHEGFAIHDILIGTGKKIITIVEGVAASIASVILMAGSERKITENSRIGIHNPWRETKGTAEQHQKAADILRSFESQMANMYVYNTGLSLEKIESMMKEEIWMDANTALELGFCTSISVPIKAVAMFNLNHKVMTKEELENSVDTKFNTFFDKIKALFKSEAFTVSTASGEILDFGSQINDGSMIAEGMTASIEGKSVDGEQLLPDGRTLVFAGGKITKIVPAKDMAQVQAELEAVISERDALIAERDQLSQSVNALKTEFDDFKSQIKSDIQGFQKDQNITDGGETVRRPFK